MTWDEYYEKINDWAVSTAVNKISSLDSIGEPDEVVDALNIIAFEDEKGASRLLNRAIQQGITFSGENLAEISSICSEDSFMKALRLSESKLKAQDLEDLYGCIDDEIIIDIARKYHIDAPKDIAEDYEEELCPDTSIPISWKKFYDNYCEWNREYAIARSKVLSDFGNGDEVVEVANELFGMDEYEASEFIHRAVMAGVIFEADDLSEIASLCDQDTIREAVETSGSMLDDSSLEDLYGIVDDDVIVEVAKKQNLHLPEDMCEEDQSEDNTDLMDDIQSAIEAADYALDCLCRAQDAMDTSGSASILDMLSNSFFPSLLKYSALEDAEQEVRVAQQALEDLNTELHTILRDRKIRLQYDRLASAIDLWFDSGFLDCLTHLQIEKAQKRIRSAIRQVEDVKRELKKALR